MNQTHLCRRLARPHACSSQKSSRNRAGARFFLSPGRVACVRVVALAKTCPQATAEVDAISTAAWGQAALPFSIVEQAATGKNEPIVRTPKVDRLQHPPRIPDAALLKLIAQLVTDLPAERIGVN